MKVKIFILSKILVFNAFLAFSQNKISIQLLPITHNGKEEIKNWTSNIQQFLIEKIVANATLTLVERDKLLVLHKEKELQKSEDFIDGKVVEQGKAMGAMFIFEPKIDVSNKIFLLKVIDVEKGSVSNIEKCDVAEALKWLDDDFEKIEKTLNRSVEKILPTKRVKVVRFSNPEKAELLIAMGQSANVKKKQSLVIYYLTNEKVDGNYIEREINVAKAKIIELQGDYFSIASLSDGEKEVQSLLQKGTKLFCKIQ